MNYSSQASKIDYKTIIILLFSIPFKKNEKKETRRDIW